MFVVYKATNTITGKVYVGKSAAGLEKRRQSHLATARTLGKNSSVFHRAINSYGSWSFTWEVLETCTDHKHMNDREVFHIAANDCLHPKGYNMTLGGGSYGYQRTPETKEILSQKMKDCHKDPAYRAAHYPKLRGLTPPNKGVPMPAEQKAKLSVARKAVYADPTYVNPNVGKKRSGEALSSLRTAYKETRNLPKGSDWEAAHGAQYTDEVRAKMRAAKLGKKPSNTKQVLCIETGQVFNGLQEAATAMKIQKQSIYLQIKGKIKSAGGFHFKYLS